MFIFCILTHRTIINKDILQNQTYLSLKLNKIIILLNIAHSSIYNETNKT